MLNMSGLLLFIFILTILLTYLVRHYALINNMMDIPNQRSSHRVSTPRGGGIAIVLSFFVGIFLALLLGYIELNIVVALFGAGLLVAGIGFLDDKSHVSQKLRLFIHFISAGWALYWLQFTPHIQIYEYLFELEWVILIVSIVFLVWLLNLYNFMDGIDGLASSETIFVTVVGATFSWLVQSNNHFILFLLLAAAASGFLVWNWPPAKIFMGDAGSGFLGLSIGILCYSASITSGITIWVWLIILGVFLVDASFTLLRRMFRGDRWYEAHCSHAYQFAARKWGHLLVSSLVSVINIIWLLPLAYIALNNPKWGVILTLIAYIPLILAAGLIGAGKLEYENKTSQAYDKI